MKTTNRLILFCLLFASFLSLNGIWTSTTDTFAYFSDVEYSSVNTLAAGVWESGAAFTNSNEALSVSDNKALAETPEETSTEASAETSTETSDEAPTETSTEPTEVPVGNEADFLIVSDSAFVKNTEDNEKSNGITFNVSGTRDVTIDKIQVWWNVSQGNTSHITEITIEGREFFSGSNSAGEIIDGPDYLLEADSFAKLELFFDSDVSDIAPFTINITMGDGSIKSFVTDPR